VTLHLLGRANELGTFQQQLVHTLESGESQVAPVRGEPGIGKSSTATAEGVYRKQIRPVSQGGAVAMDRIFKDGPAA
jgi:hypothetical protein